MEYKINAGVHNRFDFVITEKDKPLQKYTLGDNAEYEAEGTKVITTHNVILDRMWTQLCNGSSFGGYISIGNGTGVPKSSDTGLFSWVAGKSWTQDSQYRGFDTDGITPLGYWRGYIQFAENEQNGINISEVGVGYGNSNSTLVTHALLQDAEGNPITFEKTDTKTLRIYATIYSSLTTSGNNSIWKNPKSNGMLIYLTGGVFPGLSVEVSNARINTNLQKYSSGTSLNTPSFSATKSLTRVADVANKRINGNVGKYITTEANINCINSIGIVGVGYVNKNQYDNINSTGVDYNNKLIGIGDGINKRFDIPSYNSNDSTVSSPSHGALTTKSAILPCYMTDEYLTNFTGIATTYYAKYNIIKDTTGNYKSYLYKSDTIISRMYGNKQTDAVYSISTGMSGLSDNAVILSCDGFGTDDGYIFDFKNKNMKVCYYNENIFKIDVNITPIIFDENFDEIIQKAYIYKDKNILLITDNYAGMYKQVSKNNFEKLWKIKTHNNSIYDNFTKHVYKNGMYWQNSQNNLPSTVGYGFSVYDSINNRILVVSGGGGTPTAYIAKYNAETGKYDYTANNLPNTVNYGFSVYDSTNDRILVVGGGVGGGIGGGTPTAYIAKYNAETDKYDYTANNLPSAVGNGFSVYDSTNDRILIVGGRAYDANSATAYIAKYNAETDKYDYTANNLPSAVGYGFSVYDSINNRILVVGGSSVGSATAYIAKYNAETGKYDYTANNLPSTVGYGFSVYDSINNRILVVGGGSGGSATAYIAKYNTATGKYDYTANNLPLIDTRAAEYGFSVYDSINNRILVNYGGNASKGAACIAKYNAETDKYDYTANNLPSAVGYGYSVYDSTNDRAFVSAGTIVAKYNVEIDKYAINNYFVTVQNVLTEKYNGGLVDSLSLFDNLKNFAITNNQIAVNNANENLIIEYEPNTFNFVRKNTYKLNSNMEFTSTPEFDIIVSSYNKQYFHHGKQKGYGEIGSDTAGNVAYLSDTIIKAPYSMISKETSIPDGVSYVEFETAPPSGEEVKLNWHCRGYDKQAALGQFAFDVSAYIQFGSE